MEDLVTVVVPCYNVEQYLNECVESILHQTYENMEIILVDDGSTDSTGTICDSYLYDKRVKVIHKKNGGSSSARNAGLDIAKGKWIYFCDSDDYLEHNLIQNMYSIFFQKELEVIFFDYYEFKIISGVTSKIIKKYDINTSTYNGIELLSLLLSENKYEASVPIHFYNVGFLKGNHIRFQEGIIYEDELFTYEVYIKCKRIEYIDQAMYWRRIRPNSIMTASITNKNFDSFSKIVGYIQYDAQTNKNEKKYRKIRLIYLARLYDLWFCKILELQNRKEYLRKFYKHLLDFKKNENYMELIMYTKWKLLFAKYLLLSILR